MTPKEFISHWSPGGGGYGMSERAGAQPHFMGLCTLLGIDAPNDADNYTFEKGTQRIGGKRGWRTYSSAAVSVGSTRLRAAI